MSFWALLLVLFSVQAQCLANDSIHVPLLNKSIDLKETSDAKLWQSLPAKEIDLEKQLIVAPFTTTLIPSITVKTFHNKQEIYFYLTWEDKTENRLHGLNKFSDACAVMFSLGHHPDPSTIIMGMSGKTNIWHWKASSDQAYWIHEMENGNTYVDWHYPYEAQETLAVSKKPIESAAGNLVSIGVGTLTFLPNQNVEARGLWDQNVWHVIFKRNLKADDSENEAVFGDDEIMCAFAVWDGDKGDTGGRKSISSFLELELK